MLNNVDSIEEPILNNYNENEHERRITLTKWKVKHSCCCCGPYVELYIPHSKKKRHFLRGWEFQPLMPIIVSILILFTTITHFVCFFPKQYLLAQIITPFFIILFLILFVWSYFGAVCMDPGYLPYNWIRTKKYSYTWQEQLSGLAVTDEQFNFALTKENRPPKCSFSHTAGRYVIRADHICGWVANWIGKRNHKQFILMNLYGGIFALTLSTGPFFVKNFFSLPLTILFVGIVAFSIDISFAFSLLAMFGTTIVDLARNRTKLHRMRDEVNDSSQLNEKTDLNETIYERKITMKASMQEVCGNSSCFYWMIPTPAFDDTMIIDDNPDEIFQAVDDDRPPQPKRIRHKHRHHRSRRKNKHKDKELNYNVDDANNSNENINDDNNNTDDDNEIKIDDNTDDDNDIKIDDNSNDENLNDDEEKLNDDEENLNNDVDK